MTTQTLVDPSVRLQLHLFHCAVCRNRRRQHGCPFVYDLIVRAVEFGSQQGVPPS